jgi:D-alanyl-D-alanine carboxypeptidase
MKFQGLLLAAIILISLFITAPHNYFLTQEKPSQFLTTVTKTQEPAVNNFTQTAMAINSTFKSNTVSSSNVQPENKKQTISAQVFLKKLLNTNVDLAEQKIENRWPVASLTKLMTALVVIEKTDLNSEITMSDNAVNQDGAIGDFKAGEKYKAEDLLKAALVLSSNDAATALAETLRIDNFVSEMNKKALELGMESTKFVDPTGLSYLNQSTANDLAKLVNYIYFDRPEILKITTEKKISITELNSGKAKSFYSINEFAGELNFIGGKTGFINESRGNLISVFKDDSGRGPILIIVLGSDDRFGDTKILLNNLEFSF